MITYLQLMMIIIIMMVVLSLQPNFLHNVLQEIQICPRQQMQLF